MSEEWDKAQTYDVEVDMKNGDKIVGKLYSLWDFHNVTILKDGCKIEVPVHLTKKIVIKESKTVVETASSTKDVTEVNTSGAD